MTEAKTREKASWVTDDDIVMPKDRHLMAPLPAHFVHCAVDEERAIQLVTT